VCKHLDTDASGFVELLRAARAEPGVRHVFVASGIRHDLAEKNPSLVREIARHHTGGQLSVAPEHVALPVLSLMRKPGIESYERFAATFARASEEAGKKQFLVPYFLTGHPGSTMKNTIDLALWLKARGLRPRQVQDFIPTPMTVATAMYHTGVDPATGDPVAVVRDLREKRMMKALVTYWDEANAPLVRAALRAAGRRDLIGRGPGCLVPAEGAPTSSPASRTSRASPRTDRRPTRDRQRRSPR
jgi:uncharacterized radical SAM protein YgiQ